MTHPKLPLSIRSYNTIIDEFGERTVLVADLCKRFRVDALIRVPHRDYDLVEKLTERYTHFNLEFTLNQPGKRYAVLPIIRPGYRTPDNDEIVPALDPTRFRIGLCETVQQQVPVQDVTVQQFQYSIATIQSVEHLKTALVQRYTPMFPLLSSEQLLSRGCAITQIQFVSS